MTQGQKQNVLFSGLVWQTQGNGSVEEKWFNGNNTLSIGIVSCKVITSIDFSNVCATDECYYP